MPCRAITVMLQGLLGVLLASSLCSAMLMPNITTRLYSEDEGSADDPNTHVWPSDEGMSGSSDDTPPWPPSLPRMHAPIKGLPMPPPGGFNMTGRMIAAPLPPPDFALCDMLLSIQPPLPPEELPFFCLCTHCKGTTGPKGDRGDQGPPGAPGSPGMRGMTGFRGRPGFTGPPGSKGQKGDLGQKGETGSTGFTGMKGERGHKGEKGDRGNAGPQGPLGPQGETGTCPASCQSVEGPPGTQGPAGPPGARGLPGVKGAMGPKGHAGDKGDMGTPGEAGMDGMKGDQGEKGMCECSDGADGTDGRPGAKGAKGGKGDRGTQGEQGLMGVKGDHGQLGPMGMPGPCSPAVQSAFSACINESFPRPNWPVPFPHVLSNQQGHFDPLMGVYSAPVNGTYVFSYHLAVAGRILKVGIFVNFYPKLKSTELGSQSSTSQMLVQHLSAGDRVWLQVKSDTTNGMFTDSESSSTFTGHLLHPDSCDMPMIRHHAGVAHMNLKGAFRWDPAPPHTTTSPPPQ